MLRMYLLVETWVIVVPIVAVVLIGGGIALYVFWGKGKHLDNEILEVENHLGQINALPIKEKLAKLEVIGKNNVVFNSVYEEYQNLQKESESYYQLEIVPDIEKARAELKNKKYENTATALKGLQDKVSTYETKINKIDQRLNEVLKDDISTRSYETTVREKFKQYHDLYLSMEDDVSVYKEELENREKLIQDKFAGYDENLRRGHFDDANDELHDIEKMTADATAYLNDTHQAIVMITKELPRKLNETITMFNEMKDQYPLYHIAVGTNVTKIKDSISQLAERLRMFDAANINDSIQPTNTEIDELRGKLENERESRIEYEEKHDTCCDKESDIEKSHNKYMREVSHLSTIYKIDDKLKAKSNQVRSDVQKLSIIRKSLESLECGNQPYSLRVVKIREMATQIDAVGKSIDEYKKGIEELKSDAENAYQLVYDSSYQLKNAELDLRNAKHDIMISRYVESFNKAYAIIEKLNNIIGQTPIDISETRTLTSDLKMISERLLNDVKLDLETKEYCEQLIVFANAYRGNFSDIARSTSKAEDLYRTGRFKEAIDILNQAILTSRLELPEPLKRNPLEPRGE